MLVSKAVGRDAEPDCTDQRETPDVNDQNRDRKSSRISLLLSLLKRVASGTY